MSTVAQANLSMPKVDLELRETLKWILPIDIVRMVSDYSQPYFTGKFLYQWNLPKETEPIEMATDLKYIYFTDKKNSCLFRYHFNGQFIDQWHYSLSSYHFLLKWIGAKIFSEPRGIDIFEDKIYVLDNFYLQVWNSKQKLLHLYNLWNVNPGLANCIKVDRFYIYITFYSQNQIFVCNHKGELIRLFGKNEIQFSQPHGMTLDEMYLYICDSNHHRIQIVTKDKGMFKYSFGRQGNKEGEFQYPKNIIRWNNLLFVSDLNSTQIFTTAGIFQRRLSVTGSLMMMNNQLYVCNSDDLQVKVFSS